MKRILCLFCFLLCSCASPTSTENFDSIALNLKNLSLPNGIYYNGHIYWEMQDENTNDVQGNNLGTLQKTEEGNCFPVSDLVGTANLKNFIGSQIYLKDDSLYLENEKKVYVFQYIEKWNEKREEIISAENYQGTEYAIPPHFVYKDMFFSIYQSEGVELPTRFKEVGKIKEIYVLSNTNFAGNIPINSILYASEFQNRFMIVKNSEDNQFYVFENKAYNSLK